MMMNNQKKNLNLYDDGIIQE